MRALGPAVALGATLCISVSGCSGGGSSPTPEFITSPVLATRTAASAGSGVIPILYVAHYGSNVIEIYDQAGSNQVPVGSISIGNGYPEGMSVTRGHQLYVAVRNAGIDVFKRGASTPLRTLLDPQEIPGNPVVDTNGTTYLTNFQTTTGGPGSVSVYAKGKKKPTATLTIPGNAFVLWQALDNKHNLYVGYETGGSTGAIAEFVNGTGTAQILPITIAFPGGMQFDRSQNLVVDDEGKSVIDVFAVPGGQLLHQYATPSGGTLVGLAMNASGKDFYVADYATNSVYEYSYPAGVLVDTITSSVSQPTGLAVDPPEPL